MDGAAAMISLKSDFIQRVKERKPFIYREALASRTPEMKEVLDL